jgi:hypothetical protein
MFFSSIILISRIEPGTVADFILKTGFLAGKMVIFGKIILEKSSFKNIGQFRFQSPWVVPGDRLKLFDA